MKIPSKAFLRRVQDEVSETLRERWGLMPDSIDHQTVDGTVRATVGILAARGYMAAESEEGEG